MEVEYFAIEESGSAQLDSDVGVTGWVLKTRKTLSQTDGYIVRKDAGIVGVLVRFAFIVIRSFAISDGVGRGRDGQGKGADFYRALLSSSFDVG